MSTTSIKELASRPYSPSSQKIASLGMGRLYYGDLYAKSFYMRGKIAELQGDKVRAREHCTKFLDLWKDAGPGLPNVEDAQSCLDRVINQ